MFSFCVLVSDKVPPPLPPSTIVEWNPALRPGQLGNEVTSLLRPFFLAARQNSHTFSCKKKTFVNTVIRRPIFLGPNRVLRLVLIWLHFWWCHERFGSEVKRSQKTASQWQWQSNICVRWGKEVHDAIASFRYITTILLLHRLLY